ALRQRGPDGTRACLSVAGGHSLRVADQSRTRGAAAHWRGSHQSRDRPAVVPQRQDSRSPSRPHRREARRTRPLAVGQVLDQLRVGVRMITVTRFDGSEFVINSDLIETLEATPDTVITFAHDKRVVVRESPEEIVSKIVSFRRRIFVDPAELISSTDKRPTR